MAPKKWKSDQPSLHEVRVYEALRSNGGWMTARAVAAAGDVVDRTSRAHCAALAEDGVVEVAKVFGGYRYRIRSEPDDHGRERVRQLEEAKRILR